MQNEKQFGRENERETERERLLEQRYISHTCPSVKRSRCPWMLTEAKWGIWTFTITCSHVWVRELDYKESWAQKNWCFWTVVLEKTLESPLDCKEMQPVHPKGNQSCIFVGRTDAKAETWPPDAKSWLIGKTPMLGKIEGRRRRGWQWMI